MPPIQSKLKGKVLHSQTREVVANVYKFMRREVEEGAPIKFKAVQERVAEATGVSLSSVRRIKSELDALQSGESVSFTTPHKERPRRSPKATLDNFNEAVVRRAVNDFYIVEKQRPTLKKIHRELKSLINFDGSISTLSKILKTLGFKWKKTRTNRQILTEHNNIRTQRIAYLRAIRKYRNENRPIIYMDETYIHSSHTTPYSWSDDSLQGLFAPMSKGKRIIIIHAGGEQGFVPNAYVRFKSGLKTGDYHDEMNFKNYEKWLKEKLIPNLPPKSVLVIDNAPYHNKQINKAPNSNSTINAMKSWLTDKGIPFQDYMLKSDLYNLIKANKPVHRVYEIDTLLAEHDHTVLRLPPYHPELNPIELIWATVKNSVAEENVTFKLNDAIQLADEKFASISQHDWKKRCDHVKQIENEYYTREGLLDESMEMIINIENDTDSEMSDCSSSSTDTEDIEGEISYTDIPGVAPLLGD